MIPLGFNQENATASDLARLQSPGTLVSMGLRGGSAR